MPASSASRSIDSSSSERVASSRTPRSRSWLRRSSGASRERVVGGHGAHSIDTCSITPIPSGHELASTVEHHVDHLIVGAGFAGLCAAIKLQEDGEPTSSSSRRAPTSAAPGATTPTPARPATSRASSTRSRSPAYDWSNSYSPQPEIQAYIKKVADGVRDARPVRLRHRRRGRRLGRREPSAGRSRTSASGTWVARTLVVGAGGLSAPKLPEIEGIETFQGELFHSARWDHDVDLTGKRVAVIGTGASAIQIVPELQKIGRGHLDVYQRTAPWIIPRNDRPYGTARAGRAAPGAGPAAALPHRPLLGARGLRAGVHHRAEDRRPAPRRRPSRTSRRASRTPSCARRSRRTSRSAASGCCAPTTTTRRSTPTTPSWSPTRSPRSPATRSSPRTATEREIDVLVVATGFYTTELPITEHVTGRARPDAGRPLARDRHGGLQGHDGPGVPEPVHARRAQHRPGPHQHDLHHRVAGRLPARRAPTDARRRACASVEPHQQDTDRWNRSLQKRMGAPCGRPAAARAGTSTRTAATPRCGHGRPSTSGAGWRRSTPTPHPPPFHRRRSPHEDARTTRWS